MTLADGLSAIEECRGNGLKQGSVEAIARVHKVLADAGGLQVDLDGRKRVFAVSARELEETILPLCSWLRGLVEDSEEAGGGERILVGLVGPAGAGKSVLSHLLCAACNLIWMVPEAVSGWAQALSMDGYSLPNSYLLSHETQNAAGQRCKMKDIKGAPCTIDVDSFLRDLLRLRTDTCDIALPVYDRDLHDPVADRVTITRAHRLVVVEGLHLLHREGKWVKVPDAFHRTIFLDVSRALCLDRVVTRKVSNGRSRESSLEHFHRLDGPVYDRLQKEKYYSDIILTLSPTDGNNLSLPCIEARLGKGVQELAPWEIPPGYPESSVIVVGLNGAIQRQIRFPPTAGFSIGTVNRASSSTSGIGGKGQNVCVALSGIQQKKGLTHLVQFSGGQTGILLERMLESKGVHVISGETVAELRTCTTLLDECGAQTTEIIEPWERPLVSHEVEALLAKLQVWLQTTVGGLNGVVLAGSLPDGVPVNFPARILSAIVESSVLSTRAPVLVDSVKGLPDLLATGRVDMIKINAKELLEVVLGPSAALSATVGDRVCDGALVKVAATTLACSNHNLGWIAITNGPGDALLYSCKLLRVCERAKGQVEAAVTYWRYKLPILETIVNPIGAGDATTAMTLICWAVGVSPVDAFCAGLAAGGASCLVADNSCFDLSSVSAILNDIKVFYVTEKSPP